MKKLFITLFVSVIVLMGTGFTAFAQNNLNTPSNTNPNSSGFSLVACDGPTLPANPPELRQRANAEMQARYHRNYIPCDFNGVVLQAQKLIDIAIILGVILAIFGFTYAGWLYVTGVEKNISKAKSIFPKIVGGFIIMLSAWFIVYQLLSWIAPCSGYRALLGQEPESCVGYSSPIGPTRGGGFNP
jgi:hypothetical protein